MTTTIDPIPDYWEENSPWWRAVRLWENDIPVPNQLLEEVQRLNTATDRRIGQLCRFIELLIKDEENTVQNNDSLTRWLLTRRNSRRLQNLLH